jgi:hypothetical protein
MTQVFDVTSTNRTQIMVEYSTDTGSAFAVTPAGEQVFINARIVSRMELKEGRIYEAFLVPNYEDKRALIPWRAMRVEPVPVENEITETIKTINEQQLEEDFNTIVEVLEEFDWAITIEELSEESGMPKSRVKRVIDTYKDHFVRVDAYMLKTENN